MHIVEEKQIADKTDKIYKARPTLDTLLVNFQKYYSPGQHISLDEGMIPTKNRLTIKQYIKEKPVKWELKAFLCVKVTEAML